MRIRVPGRAGQVVVTRSVHLVLYVHIERLVWSSSAADAADRGVTALEGRAVFGA